MRKQTQRKPKQDVYKDIPFGGHTLRITEKSLTLTGIKSIIFLIVLFIPAIPQPIRIALALLWLGLFIWLLVRIVRVDCREKKPVE